MSDNIQAGDRVRVRDAWGDWHDAMAESGARYDHANRLPRTRTHASVSVSGVWPYPVNWPAEDVEKLVD